MRDRILYTEVLGYTGVQDSDLENFFQVHGITEPEALSLAVRFFGSGRIDRSFRRAEDFLHDLKDEAACHPITADTVRTVLAIP